MNDSVEVLIHPGDNIPMGDKLTRMFQEANGDYVVCVDDDDYLADDYVTTVTREIAFRIPDAPDYVGYKVCMMEDGKYTGTAISKHDGDQDWIDTPQGTGPKWPVKRDVAKKYAFPNMYVGDRIWSKLVRQDVHTGIYINRYLYYYDFWNKGTLGTEPGSPNVTTQRDVGTYPYDRSKFKWVSATI